MGSKPVSFYRVLFYIIFFAVFLGVSLSAFELFFRLTGLQMELTETAMYLGIALFAVLALRLSGSREPGNMSYPMSAPMPDIKKGDIVFKDENVSSNSSIDVFAEFGSLILTWDFLVFTGVPIAIKTCEIAVVKKEGLSPLNKWFLHSGKDLLIVSKKDQKDYSFYVHNANRWVEELNKIRK